MGGPLGEDQPDTPGAGVHEHGVAGLHRIHRGQQIVRRQALEQRGRGDVRGDQRGNLRGQCRFRGAVFGVAALGRCGDHAVADDKAADSCADRRDGATCLGADDERYWARVQAGAEVGVDEVDPDGLDLDQQVTVARLRSGGFAVVQDFGPADTTYFNCAHPDIMHRNETRAP